MPTESMTMLCPKPFTIPLLSFPFNILARHSEGRFLPIILSQLFRRRNGRAGFWRYRRVNGWIPLKQKTTVHYTMEILFIFIYQLTTSAMYREISLKFMTPCMEKPKGQDSQSAYSKVNYFKYGHFNGPFNWAFRKLLQLQLELYHALQLAQHFASILSKPWRFESSHEHSKRFSSISV